MQPPQPILIIGGGLAGTALAWRLHARGLPFLVVDRDTPHSSSKVAAGLVTPITGLRLTLNWRYAEFYATATAYYRTIEQQLGQTFYHVVPIVSLLRDDKAAAFWAKRVTQPEVQPYFEAQPCDPLVDPAFFNNPHGGFQQRQSGWLDTAAYLSASRAHFLQHGLWQDAEVPPDALDVQETHVVWQGQSFSHALFCTGWEAAQHPWFDWVPFQSARGSVLSIQADTGGESRILNQGCWLLPRADGSLRVGPTYEWTFSDPHGHSSEALAGLQTKLSALLRTPATVTGVQSGVRPIIKSRQALLGRHPRRPRIAFLNGLGSKGVLRAPWLAQHLLSHLLDGTELEAELDLAGN